MLKMKKTKAFICIDSTPCLGLLYYSLRFSVKKSIYSACAASLVNQEYIKFTDGPVMPINAMHLILCMFALSHLIYATHVQEINPIHLDRLLVCFYDCKLRSIQDFCQHLNMIMSAYKILEYPLQRFWHVLRNTIPGNSWGWFSSQSSPCIIPRGVPMQTPSFAAVRVY